MCEHVRVRVCVDLYVYVRVLDVNVWKKSAITKSKRVKLCDVSLARSLLCVVKFITEVLERQNRAVTIIITNTAILLDSLSS